MSYLDEWGTSISGIVATLRANFGWYDARVRDSRYDETGRASELPYIDEACLDEHYYDAPNDQLAQDHVYRTSGTSTGRRKKILYSPADHQKYVERRRAIFERFIRRDCRTACADLGTGHAASSAIELFGALGLTPFQIDFRAPVEDHVRALNERAPDVLFTMPMILDNLMLSSALRYRPKQIILVGDVASAAWKDRVVQRFGIARRDLMDLYGSIEVGSIAYECNRCGLYHFDDHIIPEVVNAADYYGDSALAGMGDVVVLTSIERSYFPAVRYVNNDRVVGFGRRDCEGRRCFVFERLLGRIGTEIKHGEKLSLYDISAAIHEHLEAARFEVHKTGDALVIRIASPTYTPAIGQRVIARIRALNADIDQMMTSSLVGVIEIEHVGIDQLTPSASMKQAIRAR